MKVKDAKKKVEELDLVCENLRKICKAFPTDKMTKENKQFVEEFYKRTSISHTLDFLCSYCIGELNAQKYDLQDRIDNAEI